MRARTVRRAHLRIIVKVVNEYVFKTKTPWGTLIKLKSGEMHFWHDGCYAESTYLPDLCIVVTPDLAVHTFPAQDVAEVREFNYRGWQSWDALGMYRDSCLFDDDPRHGKWLAKHTRRMP